MSFETHDPAEIRTEPTMFADGPRKKPNGNSDPAGEVGWFLQRERETRGLTLEDAKIRIAELTKKYPDAACDVNMMLSFLAQTSPQRGIVR